MRSRRSAQEEVAEVARRRLELLSAELAEIRPTPVDPPSRGVRDGSGEPPGSSVTADPAAGGASPPPGPGRHAHRSVGLPASIAGWAQDRLPAPLQGRVRLTAGHLVVVLLVALAGGVLTWWWLARADGGGTSLPPVAATGAPLVTPTATSSSSSPTGAGVSPSPGSRPGADGSTVGAAASGSTSVVVDVVGKVHRPGIATLPAGARVVDALKAAGGARRGASLASLNLARVLADGEQIVVGIRSPPGIAASAAGAAGSPGSSGATGGATPVPMVNINTADQSQLEELPGVGPVTAQSILDYRAEKGTFTAVDELLEVSGIGDVTLSKIAPYCTI